MKLINRNIIKKPKKVYNLHIQDNHNYIANDVVVSNCHSAKANALKTILTGPMAHIPLRWGLTGTVPKEKFEFQTKREIRISIIAYRIGQCYQQSICQRVTG